MGLFDIFKSTSPAHQQMVVPQAVEPKKIPHTIQEQDLQKLKQFEEKINKSAPKTEQVANAVSQEELALKLQNPFRGV